MSYDPHDTIVAIGTPPGGAARGMVRLSGPRVGDCLEACFTSADRAKKLATVRVPTVVHGSVPLSAIKQSLHCDLFFWPTARSYTCQPTAELHTLGSPPLLEALAAETCRHGARLAEPGEFTLRAFLAGRIDLTQAEAVLGVIDAGTRRELDTALAQLAGGMSQPLAALRERLLQLLAELEAGLDFVDEDIEFISREQLCRQLAEAHQIVEATRAQLTSRGESGALPLVVLVGRPNVGKSSLFNALSAAAAGDATNQPALVSDQGGTTRDYVTATVDMGGVVCELVDTAGEDRAAVEASLEAAAQAATDSQRAQADLRVVCVDANEDRFAADYDLTSDDLSLLVLTKADLLAAKPQAEGSILCSSVTGAGIDELRRRVRSRLVALPGGDAVAATAARCGEILRLASVALERADRLAARSGGEELVAAEVRSALDQLGRVVGAVYTDDILDRVFQQFCIGK